MATKLSQFVCVILSPTCFFLLEFAIPTVTSITSFSNNPSYSDVVSTFNKVSFWEEGFFFAGKRPRDDILSINNELNLNATESLNKMPSIAYFP